MVLLRCAPVVMEYAGLPIAPITQNQITQIALWRDSKKSPVVDFFIGCLNKFAVAFYRKKTAPRKKTAKS